jgi:hypothetical protein
LLSNEKQEIGLIEAIITSVNRASGAAQAKNFLWQNRQTQAAVSYLAQLSVLIGKEPSLQSTFQNSWIAAGFSTISPSATDIQSAQVTLGAAGFPSDQVQTFLQLGLSSQDIANLLQSLISLNPTQVAALGSFPANFTNQSFITDLYASAQAATMAALSSGTSCSQVYLVKASFGMKAGQPGFISQADLNGDGLVNILDLATATQQLPVGTTCP